MEGQLKAVISADVVTYRMNFILGCVLFAVVWWQWLMPEHMTMEASSFLRWLQRQNLTTSTLYLAR